MIGQFVAPAADAPGANPNVRRSLDHFARLPELGPRLRRLPASPSVLIQGYSDPGNADALAQFLAGHAIAGPRLQAIDLYDLPAVYALLGFPAPAFAYRLADASNLQGVYADGSVDVLVQDFLLNCTPTALHEPILREAARILSAEGVALISFSDQAGVGPRPKLDAAGFQRRTGVPWCAGAYNLADMFPAGALPAATLSELAGHVVFDTATGTSTLITAAGRFEFFRDAEVMRRLFQEAGLVEIATDRSEGMDSHGLNCRRYRCLLAKAP